MLTAYIVIALLITSASLISAHVYIGIERWHQVVIPIVAGLLAPITLVIFFVLGTIFGVAALSDTDAWFF